VPKVPPAALQAYRRRVSVGDSVVHCLKQIYVLVGQRNLPPKASAAFTLRDDDPETGSVDQIEPAAAGLAEQARIVRLAAEGMANYEIDGRVRVSRPTVHLRRNRYRAGDGGVGDRAASGPAAEGGASEDHRDDADATTAESGGDALVEPATGPGWGSSTPRPRRSKNDYWVRP
jgi:hypothetical protein